MSPDASIGGIATLPTGLMRMYVYIYMYIYVCIRVRALVDVAVLLSLSLSLLFVCALTPGGSCRCALVWIASCFIGVIQLLESHDPYVI